VTESIQHAIDAMATWVEAGAAMVVLLAVIAVLLITVRKLIARDPTNRISVNLVLDSRLMLGRWLGFALEVTLAAEILHTIVAPTWEELGRVTAVAALRTGINFVLEREMKHAQDT
jgi:uncharacterized membrane protein